MALFPSISNNFNSLNINGKDLQQQQQHLWWQQSPISTVFFSQQQLQQQEWQQQQRQPLSWQNPVCPVFCLICNENEESRRSSRIQDNLQWFSY